MRDETEKPLEEQCSEMAAILGLDEPVSPAVLRAAMSDPTYAHNLLAVRGQPAYMQHLLDNPPAPAPSTAGLVRSAAASLARWARTGFSTVSEQVLEHRLSVCGACPSLIAPPADKRRLYQLAGASADSRSVCRTCGCVVRVKARRTSDTCPEPHPDDPTLSRWGDPLSPTTDRAAARES